MQKRKWYLRWNRGLLLGGVLLTAVILYTLISSVMFRYQKDEIADTVREFIEETAEIQVSQNDTNTEGVFSNIVDRYCVKPGSKLGGGIYYEEYFDRDQMKGCFTARIRAAEDKVTLHALTVDIDEEKDFYIKRAGSSYATVECYVQGNVRVTMPESYYYGADDSFALAFYLPGTYIDNTSFKDYVGEEDDPMVELTGTFTYNVTFYMERTGGEWKINSVARTYLWGNMEGNFSSVDDAFTEEEKGEEIYE